MDRLSVALSYDYDFTQLEEIKRHTCVPQNMHETTLALQALQIIPHGNEFIDLVLSHKKSFVIYFAGPQVRNETFSQ